MITSLIETVEYYADLRKAFQSSVPNGAIPNAIEIVEALVGEAWEGLE
jgi:hypothetical protein